MPEFHLSVFQELVDSDFQVDDADGPACTLHLEKIEVRIHTPEHEDFSLLLRGPRDVFLPQGTFIFNHAATGRFTCFIVPVGEDNRGFIYGATFNLLPQVRDQ